MDALYWPVLAIAMAVRCGERKSGRSLVCGKGTQQFPSLQTFWPRSRGRMALSLVNTPSGWQMFNCRCRFPYEIKSGYSGEALEASCVHYTG
jgi:hypothetical protein